MVSITYPLKGRFLTRKECPDRSKILGALTAAGAEVKSCGMARVGRYEIVADGIGVEEALRIAREVAPAASVAEVAERAPA